MPRTIDPEYNIHAQTPSETISAALRILRDCDASIISPLAAAKKIVRLFGYGFYCDKLKNGTHSLKLHKHGFAVSDTESPYELTGILCQLCAERKTMGYPEHDRYNRESPIRRSETETITRYYFN